MLPFRQKAALMLQQPAFGLESSCITGQAAICTNNAMTGDDQGQGIVFVGQTDSPASALFTKAYGYFSVGGRLAIGDRADTFPDFLLKGTSFRFQGQREVVEPPLKILPELTAAFLKDLAELFCFRSRGLIFSCKGDPAEAVSFC